MHRKWPQQNTVHSEDLSVADPTGDSVTATKDSRVTPVIQHAEVTTTKAETAFQRVFAADKNVQKTAQR